MFLNDFGITLFFVQGFRSRIIVSRNLMSIGICNDEKNEEKIQ